MSHDAAEHGINIVGADGDEDWDDAPTTCSHIDPETRRGCLLPPGHDGEHQYPVDPLADE